MRRRNFLAGSAAFIASPMSVATASDAIAVSGNRFRVGEEDYQLADILAPSAYTLGPATSPHADKARARLQHHIGSSAFEYVDVSPRSRWGARIVRSSVGDGTPLLEELLVSDGAARVAPQTDDMTVIERLLRAERVARRDKKGLWGLDTYQVFDADDASGAIGDFHLIEGTVAGARKARSRFYLNFGDDYRTDFTASTVSMAYRKWLATGFDLASLDGVRVRIRGFVVYINGPSVDLTHRSQIEVLSAI